MTFHVCYDCERIFELRQESPKSLKRRIRMHIKRGHDVRAY